MDLGTGQLYCVPGQGLCVTFCDNKKGGGDFFSTKKRGLFFFSSNGRRNFILVKNMGGYYFFLEKIVIFPFLDVFPFTAKLFYKENKMGRKLFWGEKGGENLFLDAKREGETRG